MKLQRTFVGAKMNKDNDERLLQSGELRHVVNTRISGTDGGNSLGVAENTRGNKQLTNLGLINGETIGAYADSFNNLLYWLVCADNKDMLLEYDFVNKVLSIVLESNKGGTLNLSKTHLVTAFNKVINGDKSKDLLFWTDDYNPPRCINIARAKTYGLDGFIEEDISVIKAPPRFAPLINQTYTTTSLENNLEDKFLSFCYRYKYLDGQYSALSSFTNYQFTPTAFDIDYQTMENKGMVNKYNAVNIVFNTGGHTVTDIELVYKESNSNALYVIETFNKKRNAWADNSMQSFKFSNSKKYVALPEKELYRPYDNVPLKAQAQTMIGNIIVYGNYLEGYNMVDSFGEEINLNLSLGIISKDVTGKYLTATALYNRYTIGFSDVDLKVGNKITFTIYLKEVTYNKGSFNSSFDFILNKDYANVKELAEDPDFIFFVENIMTNGFKERYVLDPPQPSSIEQIIPFKISEYSLTYKTIIIDSPIVVVKETGSTPPTIRNTIWYFLENSSVFYYVSSSTSSVKTNRSYEIGVIYKDKQGRSSTPETTPNNTIYIPQSLSDMQNKIQVTVSSKPPYWADRYQFVVKQNKMLYQNIFANIFYQDGLYRWVKLEGVNKDKVKEGDVLIVKSDLGGIRRDIVKTRVLEVAQKEKDFLVDNEDTQGNKIVEEAGLYMKIKPAGFDMSWRSTTVRTFEGSNHLRYPVRTWTQPIFGTKSETAFTPWELKGGSTVRIYIKFQAFGNISYEAVYDKTYRVQGNYIGVKEWFMAEVMNLGSFGKQWTWDGVTDIGDNIGDEGRGQADEWHMNSGWGFAEDGSSFFVVPHRKGTASRNIGSEVRFEIMYSDGTVIFETEPKDAEQDIFYSTEEDFPIVNGNHTGNIQDQDGSITPAIVELDFFNCYSQGSGVESYQYKDAFNSNYLNIDLRPTAVAIEKFKEVRRYADLTYSTGAYVENNGINGLNEFNLSEANYKEDIDKSYGYIKKLYTRDTDILCLQENKVHRVLYNKELLMNADGTGNITGTKNVLGKAIPIQGEFGITRPESFVPDDFTVKWVDDKRGVVLRLIGDEYKDISGLGMSQFFRDSITKHYDNKKVAAYDAKYKEYVLSIGHSPVRPTETIACSDTVEKFNFTGSWTFFVTDKFRKGETGVSLSTNGKPVRFKVTVNGVTTDFGFYGDSSYDDELIAMGFPPTVGTAPNTIHFTKTDASESGYLVETYSPFEGVNMTLNPICIIGDEVNVTFVVRSGKGNDNWPLNITYAWYDEDRQSQTITENVALKEGISLFKKYTGERGLLYYPELESGQIIKITENETTAGLFGGGVMKVYMSDTELTEADAETIFNNGVEFDYTKQPIPSGGNSSTGTSPIITTKKFIYIALDVQEGIVAYDKLYDCERGGQIEENLVWDNPISSPYEVIFVDGIYTGTIQFWPSGSFRYTNDPSMIMQDSFRYKIKRMGRESNIATATITIYIPW